MKWMRCRQGERELFGLLEGDRLAVHEGDLFGAARPTGERVDLAGAQWLMPCRPTKMLAARKLFHSASILVGWQGVSHWAPVRSMRSPVGWASPNRSPL